MAPHDGMGPMPSTPTNEKPRDVLTGGRWTRRMAAESPMPRESHLTIKRVVARRAWTHAGER